MCAANAKSRFCCDDNPGNPWSLACAKGTLQSCQDAWRKASFKAFTECTVCNYSYALMKRRRTREFALKFAKLVLQHFIELLAETIAFPLRHWPPLCRGPVQILLVLLPQQAHALPSYWQVIVYPVHSSLHYIPTQSIWFQFNTQQYDASVPVSRVVLRTCRVQCFPSKVL